MDKIIWIDSVKNEEVLRVVKEEGNILHTAIAGRLTSGVGTAF